MNSKAKNRELFIGLVYPGQPKWLVTAPQVVHGGEDLGLLKNFLVGEKIVGTVDRRKSGRNPWLEEEFTRLLYGAILYNTGETMCARKINHSFLLGFPFSRTTTDIRDALRRMKSRGFKERGVFAAGVNWRPESFTMNDRLIYHSLANVFFTDEQKSAYERLVAKEIMQLAELSKEEILRRLRLFLGYSIDFEEANDSGMSYIPDQNIVPEYIEVSEVSGFEFDRSREREFTQGSVLFSQDISFGADNLSEVRLENFERPNYDQNKQQSEFNEVPETGIEILGLEYPVICEINQRDENFKKEKKFLSNLELDTTEGEKALVTRSVVVNNFEMDKIIILEKLKRKYEMNSFTSRESYNYVYGSRNRPA